MIPLNLGRRPGGQLLASTHLASRQSQADAPRRHRILVGDAPVAKIRLPAQAAKYVADVVLRRDAFRVGAVPVVDDAPDYLGAGEEDVLDGDLEAILLRGRQVLEV